MVQGLYILALAFLQNVSFSIVSRARNRDNFTYLIFASVGSNIIWFLTFRELVLGKMNFFLLIPYTIGTVAGTLGGTSLSMAVERRLNATSDGHLKKAG